MPERKGVLNIIDDNLRRPERRRPSLPSRNSICNIPEVSPTAKQGPVPPKRAGAHSVFGEPLGRGRAQSYACQLFQRLECAFAPTLRILPRVRIRVPRRLPARASARVSAPLERSQWLAAHFPVIQSVMATPRRPRAARTVGGPCGLNAAVINRASQTRQARNAYRGFLKNNTNGSRLGKKLSFFLDRADSPFLAANSRPLARAVRFLEIRERIKRPRQPLT